ncbi:hypothetical protein BP5796_02840 [Coleophoma crateriformis]|uniref:Nucleoside phosphorylase domain-containing protein n=1 Tax=Coleophoma crateriformis TaxID=565419 RepID=A0A3D8SZD3_9HELO|nr:hypothetical protein BP5796_02840 [Coleophoma crateriformis]
MSTKTHLRADAYTVGIIYVKSLEMRAISVMLDEKHQPVALRIGDDNEYTLGRIESIMLNVHMGLLVGIGGGVPGLPEHDVRLGDVVVGAPDNGPAVIQYDLGKQYPDGVHVERMLNKPPGLLLKVVDKVDTEYHTAGENEPTFFTRHMQRFAQVPRMRDMYKHPSVPDRLFKSDYNHETAADCATHDASHQVERPYRNPTEIRVHYSAILSGDLVMKSAVHRDQLSAKFHGALCFEMEAAGVMDTFPCLVVRGICDYSDSHKSKEWHEYAAAAAASYMRELLSCMAERITEDFRSGTPSEMEQVRQNVPFVSAIWQNENFTPPATKQYFQQASLTE